jgi:hypothetical protein
MCRGRFWALSGLEDGGGGEAESEEESAGDCRDEVPELSPDSDSGFVPGRATLRGFISRAEELGGLSSAWPAFGFRSRREGFEVQRRRELQVPSSGGCGMAPP